MSNCAYRKQENCDWKCFYRFNRINVYVCVCASSLFPIHVFIVFITIFNGVVLFFSRYYSYNKSFKSMKSTRIFIYFHLIVISQLFGTFYALMRCFCAFLTHYTKQLIKAMRLPVNGNNYSMPFKCQTKKIKAPSQPHRYWQRFVCFEWWKIHVNTSVNRFFTFRFIFFFIISLKCITDIKRPTKKMVHTLFLSMNWTRESLMLQQFCRSIK